MTIHRLLAATALGSFAFPASAADTATDPIRHHMQCFLAMSALAGSDDAKTQEAGTIGTMFFAGQIFGANPAIDLPAAATREMAGLTDDKLPGLLTECSAELEKRGDQMQDAATALGAK